MNAKRLLIILSSVILWHGATAQAPLRPDAFPPVEEQPEAKALAMASTIEEMESWDRYPTYAVYVEMMRRFASSYPTLCRLDTIGTSVRGRLILALEITSPQPVESKKEFFYSSTIHGDELTGFYFMLRLCDTLLRSYGTAEDITQMLDRTVVCINPLANPDGTYNGGDSTVARAIRYNANRVDLNRNYPDPFGTDPLNSIQPENQAMISYVSRHRFLLSANLHGGSEVMNYPWDSFTSSERLNEHHAWWKEVSKRYVDTCRLTDANCFRSVNSQGYINGGDWYVIRNGRQDYMNYFHSLRELTMEVSSTKSLSTSSLRHYWDFQRQSLINYIKEIYDLDTPAESVADVQRAPRLRLYPNPTRGPLTVEMEDHLYHFDLSGLPSGMHIIRVNGIPAKVIKL